MQICFLLMYMYVISRKRAYWKIDDLAVSGPDSIGIHSYWKEFAPQNLNSFV